MLITFIEHDPQIFWGILNMRNYENGKMIKIENDITAKNYEKSKNDVTM